jgi:hypothetical protein
MTLSSFNCYIKPKLTRRQVKAIVEDDESVDFEWACDTDWCYDYFEHDGRAQSANCAVSLRFRRNIVVNIAYNGSSPFALWACGWMDDEV